MAISIPLRNADCEPKFREWLMPITRRSFREMARITSSVSSGLQSLTKMISKSMFSLVNVALSRSYMIGIAWLSL